MKADAADPLAAQVWPLGQDEALAAALLAIDPIGLGGACLRAAAGPWRQAWLDRLQALLPAGTPLRRLPHGASDSALLGGLDLAATLSRGQPVLQPGLLSQANGGLLLLAMAERASADTAAKLASVLDTRQLHVQRDAMAHSQSVQLGVVALDEGLSDDETLPPALQDRLAFWLQPPEPASSEQEALLQAADLEEPQHTQAAHDQAEQVQAARARLAQLPGLDERQLKALCATALALGIDSMRPPLLAARVARAAAALAGAAAVEDEHASLAARLVLAPRATRLPTPETADADDPQDAPEPSPPPDQPPHQPADPPPPPEQQAREPDGQPDTPQEPDQSDEPDDRDERPSDEQLQEMMIAAACASLSPGLLAALRAGQQARQTAGAGGKAGSAHKNFRRGRPLGPVRGELRGGARLSLLATLRAAAAWQTIRKRSAEAATGSANAAEAATRRRRIEVRQEDFHIMRYKQQRSTTTVFVVDASGSAALHRLAEAKGAVELLLADCYVRRDRVALIAFRGSRADLLLAPTRSLARAKRSLAGLPGGGGTPLAAALEAAHALVQQIARSGDTPVLVLLTDGRANIARDGSPGRAKASEDALAAARPLAASSIRCLLIDTSPQPQASAQALAQAMRAHYVPLPHADAQGLSQAVRLAQPRTL
jgi:magnesium chelatase subunit D